MELEVKDYPEEEKKEEIKEKDECLPCKLSGALEILLSQAEPEQRKELVRKYIRCEATLEDIAKEVKADPEIVEVIKKEVPIDKTCCELNACQISLDKELEGKQEEEKIEEQ